MPVIIEYVVERDGMEKMTFTSKTEADAYDKLLDTADNISQLLEKSELVENKQIQQLAIYLAKHRDDLINALAYKRKTIKPSQEEKKVKDTKKSKPTNNTAPQSLLDIVIEPDEDAVLNVAEEALDQSNNEVAA